MSSVFGKGTEFKIRIPLEPTKLREESEIGVTSTSDCVSVPDNLYGKVLLVEDNPVNLMLGRTILERFDVDVATAENGEIAINMLSKEQFDLILMDIQMPILDGIAATKIIRQSAMNNSNIPVVAISANLSSTLRKDCIEAGMNGFLLKPFRKSALIEKVAEYLRKERKNTELLKG